MAVSPSKIENLLRTYGIHTPVRDERFMSHAQLDRGTRLRILCVDDPMRGNCITVTSKRFKSTQACPLSPDDAASLVNELRRVHLIPDETHERNTLEHLLLRCSTLYTSEKLKRLELSPLYLRANDYRIAGVKIEPGLPLDAQPRLAPDAHDTGAVFAYRPTARLRPARKK